MSILLSAGHGGGGWFLSMGPGVWSALGVWATVGVASVAAVVAFVQVREARRLREAQAQPFVVVALEPSEQAPQIFLLTVRNIGTTLARDVKFAFDPPLKSLLDEKDGRHKLSESTLVREGIPFMPPGMEIERVFDSALEWGPGGAKAPSLLYDVEVQFSDYRGRAQAPLRYRIDLAAFISGTYIARETFHDLAKSVKALEQHARRWTEGAGGLRVWSRNGDERDAHEREQFEAYRAAQGREGSQRED